MKVHSVRIESLQLTLPRTKRPGARDDATSLAKAVAKTLASSLEHSGLSAGSHQIPKLQLRVPRGEANASGIADAIQKSIVRSTAPGEKEK